MAYGGIDPGVQTTAFGDIDVAQPTAKVQLQFTYGVNPYETRNFLTGSGTVTSAPPFAVVQSGAATNSSALLFSDMRVPYRPGQGGLYLFTALFRTGVAGNVQLVGCGGTVNGLFFGYNGTVFGIDRRSNGVDNWVVQNSWNGDPMNGTGITGMTLNPLLGNVYRIQMQWLGFGVINFFIENPDTGKFVRVHTIRYPNSATETSLLQPSAPLFLSSTNTTNNTNISIQCPSMAGFVEGIDNQIGNLFSFNNTKSISTTETCIFNLRNNTTFGGVPNFKTIKLLNFSITNNIRINNFFLRLNAVIGGAPVFVNINPTQSCAAADTAGTTAVGGAILFSAFLRATTYTQLNLSPYNILLAPGDILTLSSANQAGAAANNIGSLNWIEIF